jgi:uncharacterized protein (TIGR02246 family)
MKRLAAFVLALCGTTAGAAEVTVIRPKALIAEEWAYYVLLDGQTKPTLDVRSGERVTFQVPTEARSLVIQCPKGLGAAYDESRIDFDFKASPRAYFLITAQPACVSIAALDEKTASTWIGRTRSRPAGRIVEYDPPAKPGDALVKATPASVAALTLPDSAAKDQIAAATAGWVEAFNSRDPARLSALYDAEAVLTDAAEARPLIGTAAIADYYKNAVKRKTQRVALGERNLRLLGDTAIDSGALTYFEMRDGNAITTPGRYNLTYQKRGGKWLIVDHQTSTPR